MNELNLVSPVNNASPEFIAQNLHQNPTLVKHLQNAIGSICVIEKLNSANNSYAVVNENDYDIATKTLRYAKTGMKTANSKFLLLQVEIDDRNNIMLKCLNADEKQTDNLVYWMPFFARTMKLSVIG